MAEKPEPRLSIFGDFCNENLIRGPDPCYIDFMKRKGYWVGVLFWAILWGLSACGTVQIVSEKKPTPEPARPEKSAPGKTPPQSPSPAQTPAEKSFFEKIMEKIAPPDSYSRSYPVEFSSFHVQANSALQEYARTRKGNSFSISRLGSDEVVLRGIYLREGTPQRYSTTLTLKSAGPKKSQMEIKVAPAAETTTSGDPEAAAKEIFSIVEKSLGTKSP